MNLSPSSLFDAGFAPDALLAELANVGLASNQVVIEITENASALDYGDLRQAVSEMRAAGIESISAAFARITLGRFHVSPDFRTLTKKRGRLPAHVDSIAPSADQAWWRCWPRWRPVIASASNTFCCAGVSWA